MGKSSTGPMYRCAECGWRTTKWSGRCGGCQAWGTVEETAGLARLGPGGRSVAQVMALAGAPAVPITEVDSRAASVRPTGLDELDRVLGGGLVPGAVVLLAGEPGVGKSTLLLEAGDGPVLGYVPDQDCGQGLLLGHGHQS
jgi:DNA repair protein RadA/Sms